MRLEGSLTWHSSGVLRVHVDTRKPDHAASGFLREENYNYLTTRSLHVSCMTSPRAVPE